MVSFALSTSGSPSLRPSRRRPRRPPAAAGGGGGGGGRAGRRCRRERASRQRRPRSPPRLPRPAPPPFALAPSPPNGAPPSLPRERQPRPSAAARPGRAARPGSCSPAANCLHDAPATHLHINRQGASAVSRPASPPARPNAPIKQNGALSQPLEQAPLYRTAPSLQRTPWTPTARGGGLCVGAWRREGAMQHAERPCLPQAPPAQRRPARPWAPWQVAASHASRPPRRVHCRGGRCGTAGTGAPALRPPARPSR